MDENMKLNAIKNLMKSLEFNRQDKMALMEMLKQDLYPEEPKGSVDLKEYGSEYKFPMLYEDGMVSHYLRRDQFPVGVIVECCGEKFAIYCKQHECFDNTNRQEAERYASTLPMIGGRAWKIISTRHCKAINVNSFFHSLNDQLHKVGWRTIVESRNKEVLTYDGSLSAKDWEVWFVMDL